jgi:hypothetical protein
MPGVGQRGSKAAIISEISVIPRLGGGWRLELANVDRLDQIVRAPRRTPGHRKGTGPLTPPKSSPETVPTPQHASVRGTEGYPCDQGSEAQPRATVLDSLARKQNGELASCSYFTRRRAVLHNALHYAVTQVRIYEANVPGPGTASGVGVDPHAPSGAADADAH